MNGHLRSLRVFNFAMAALDAIAALSALVLGIVMAILMCQDDVPGCVWALLLGVGCGLLFGVRAAVHVAVGYMVGSGRGRVAQTVLALMWITAFPIGTVYGVYALWVCWLNEATAARFASAVKPPIT